VLPLSQEGGKIRIGHKSSFGRDFLGYDFLARLIRRPAGYIGMVLGLRGWYDAEGFFDDDYSLQIGSPIKSGRTLIGDFLPNLPQFGF